MEAQKQELYFLICTQQVPYTIKEIVSFRHLIDSFIKRKSVLLSPTLGRS